MVGIIFLCPPNAQIIVLFGGKIIYYLSESLF